MTRYCCPRCGIVRDAGVTPPWCRHGDVSLPATRMKVIYSAHPWASGRCRPADEAWLSEHPT
jgi:hypothetical protein